MGWDENRSITVLQRTKEGDTGYRYFPEPDLPPLDLDPAWIEQIKASLPELPDAKLARYVSEYGLTKKEAAILSEDRAIAAYYESVVATASNKAAVTPKLISNWVSGELFRLLSERGIEISQVKIKPEHLVALVALVNANIINQPAAKQTFGVMFDTGRPPLEIVEEMGLQQISDTGQLVATAQEIIAANPGPVEQFKAGKETTIKFLVGQMMKATRGKANPQLAEQVLREQLQNDTVAG
jgi:aspartyl-tRNA(Asn)/glutamyl-tRNA(Gln) amidotransferase subunit B